MFRRSITQGAVQMMASSDLSEVIVTGLRGSNAVREQLGDYHLYRVPWPTDLNARQTKQVSFLTKSDVKVERFYQQSINAYDAAGESNQIPSLMLAFENRKSGGLGEPLPEGVLRLYEPDPAGDMFAGEGNILDTAVNDPAELRLAGAVDLALQTHLEQRRDTDQDGERAGNLAEAAIRIANAKQVPITIEIRQRSDPYSAGLAQVLKSSARTYRKKGDYAWRVRVPANTDGTLTYRLRVPEPKEDDDE